MQFFVFLPLTFSFGSLKSVLIANYPLVFVVYFFIISCSGQKNVKVLLLYLLFHIKK